MRVNAVHNGVVAFKRLFHAVSKPISGLAKDGDEAGETFRKVLIGPKVVEGFRRRVQPPVEKVDVGVAVPQFDAFDGFGVVNVEVVVLIVVVEFASKIVFLSKTSSLSETRRRCRHCYSHGQSTCNKSQDTNDARARHAAR